MRCQRNRMICERIANKGMMKSKMCKVRKMARGQWSVNDRDKRKCQSESSSMYIEYPPACGAFTIT